MSPEGVMEDENNFYIRGRQGIKPMQIPSLMGFDEDATASAPPGGARTIAAARDEAIQSYFLELLPDEVPLFPIFPNELFHSAQPTKKRAPQEQATPQPPLTKKKDPSTSTATPPTRPPAPEERAEPTTPHVDTAASTPKPPAKTATATKRTLTRKDKGKAHVKPTPRTPAPEATVELDNDDDNDEEMPDLPQPPAPTMETSIPRRRLKRKANRNSNTADLATEENVASEQTRFHSYTEEKDLQYQSKNLYNTKRKEESSMNTLRVAVMLGGEAAWTVVVPSLVTFSDMQREPLDGLCGHEQWRRWVAQQIRSWPSDPLSILRSG
ncbi:hypothetical protein GQ457_03G013400 [Hibiscus cannabinus]